MSAPIKIMAEAKPLAAAAELAGEAVKYFSERSKVGRNFSETPNVPSFIGLSANGALVRMGPYWE